MTLDHDLIREILLQAERAPANQEPELQLPDRDEDEVLEHLELLIEAGFLEGHAIPHGLGGRRLLAVRVIRMTWSGHQFLASVRNEQVWSRVKRLIQEKGGGVTLEVLKALATQLAKDYFLGPGAEG